MIRTLVRGLCLRLRSAASDHSAEVAGKASESRTADVRVIYEGEAISVRVVCDTERCVLVLVLQLKIAQQHSCQ
jgi:hypothetical protein